MIRDSQLKVNPGVVTYSGSFFCPVSFSRRMRIPDQPVLSESRRMAGRRKKRREVGVFLVQAFSKVRPNVEP